MDANLRKEMMDWHMKNDTLFRRLATETNNEPDDAKFQIGVALLTLVLDGKVRIVQNNLGEMLFEHNLPN